MNPISYPCKMMNCWFELEFRIRVRASYCILILSRGVSCDRSGANSVIMSSGEPCVSGVSSLAICLRYGRRK